MTENAEVPKEPWFAVLLNSFLPGLGQFYSKAFFRGGLWIAVALALFAGISWKYLTCIYAPDVVVRPHDVRVQNLLILVLAFIYLVSFVDAFLCARHYNREEGLEPPGLKKSPWLPLLLSRFVPGLGQLYNGYFVMAGVLAAAWLLIVIFLRGSWLFVIGAPLVIGAMSNAFNGAMRMNGSGKKLFRRFGPIVSALICLFLVFQYLPYPGIAREYLFEPYRIRGGAMKPSIHPHDWIMIDKMLFRLKGIKRGEVFVFDCPDKPGDFYTKRIVGLPGEKIEIRGGKILINGEPLKTGGVIDAIPYRNYGPYGRRGQVITIPENSYYFLGDRLEKSWDSRLYGPIPMDEIVGKAVKIIRPYRRARPVR